MYKKLLIVAAFVVAFSSVAGLTSVSANDNRGNDQKQNNNGNGNNGHGNGSITTPTPELPVNIPAIPTPPIPPFFPLIPTPPTPNPEANLPILPPVTPNPTTPEIVEQGDDKRDGNKEKIEICHRTNAPKNPYRLITVSAKAVDSNGKSDHKHHSGPIATSFEVAKALKVAGVKWGDIIPTSGDYPGKAIFDAGCKYPVSTTPVEIADVSVSIICEVKTSRAIITFTNSGLTKGKATYTVGTNAPKTVTIQVGTPKVKYVTVPAEGIRITVEIPGKTTISNIYSCTGGQGGIKDPDTATPVIAPTTPTTDAPAGQAGQGVVTEPTVASLPYTAGESTQPIALIISAIAAIVAIAGTLIKKAYLKQI